MEREGHMPEGTGGPDIGEPTVTPPVDTHGTDPRATEARPPIPSADREVLERYLGPLPDEEALPRRTESVDPYGRPLADPLTAPWEAVESYTGLPNRPGLKAVRIYDQMQHQMWVYWPKDEITASERVRDVLSRIETTKGKPNQQLSTEHLRVTSILGSLTGEKITAETSDEDLKIRNIAEKLQREEEARMIFREVSHQYENSSNLEVVSKTASDNLQPEHFTALFGIKQKSKVGTESHPAGTEFNPIVESLQYYEDHGEEFTVFSSLQDRLLFGDKVQRHFAKKYGGKPGDYKSAQLLAERIFRVTCRAVMFDSLVEKEGYKIYKSGEIKKYEAYKEQAEKIEARGEIPPDPPAFTPIPAELRITDDYYTGEKRNDDKKYDWAGDGDGCDYDTRRVMRQRELLIKEQVTLHGHVQLLEGVDCYGGDFFTRNEGVAKLFKKEEKFVDFEFPGRERLNREEHNKGEKVGHVDFRQLDGKDFSVMGSGLMGLWASRCVGGAESIREALTKTSECFLRNPNEESLYKLINAFDTSKENAKEAKKQLLLNFIKFAKNEREEKTGKPKYDRAAIVGMINNLTGLTDPNKPPFTEFADRQEVLRKVFGHPFTDLITKGVIAKDFILGFFWGILKTILGKGFSDFGK